MDEMRSFVDDLYGGGYLEHYGVKGMKWGKHKKATDYDPRNASDRVRSGMGANRSGDNRASGAALLALKGKTHAFDDGRELNSKRLETAARQAAQGGPTSTSRATKAKIKNTIKRGKAAVTTILNALSYKKTKKKSSNSKNKD